MEQEKNVGGRPTVMTTAVLDKLETAWCMGATDLEACLYAGIAVSTLTKYQQSHPEYVERKNLLKTTLVLKARGNLSDAMSSSDEVLRTKTSQWYLERKARAEFATKVEVETTGTEDLRKNIQSYIDNVLGVADVRKKLDNKAGAGDEGTAAEQS